MKTVIYLLLSVVALQSCSVFSDHRVEVTLPKEYESCCGVQPVEFTLRKGFVFIPNVFTPNGDGINDYFIPTFDNELDIQGYVIKDATGDTLLFQRPAFIPDRYKELAWNGYRMDGTRYRGLFKYKIAVVSRDGYLRIIEGQACSVICEPGTAELKTKRGCFYPSQAGTQEKAGKVDSTLSNLEKDCLK